MDKIEDIKVDIRIADSNIKCNGYFTRQNKKIWEEQMEDKTKITEIRSEHFKICKIKERQT